ncbi:MAG: DUF4386 domain-containing protein [Bacteroidetes bacterium]|nr:DUF4386 domain-containing protein [Bacteroidota bacterium]MCW5894960.1 DUF4386 domain-containing protein [Bacteroidota bacterium]
MPSHRKTSLIFGLFFAGTFIFSIPALLFYDPLFNDAGYILGGGFDTRISMGALFEILLAICNIATAIVIFPIVKRVKESVALGYVAVRIVESVIILAGVTSLMSIVTLRANFVPGGDTEALIMAGRSLLAFHDWTFLLGPQFCAGFGTGLLFGYLMYRSGLLPRRMALLGLIGGPLAFLGGVLVLFDVLKPMSAGLFALTALEIAWELSIIFYTIIKGFRPSPALDAYSQSEL